jgi:hypothetical protein
MLDGRNKSGDSNLVTDNKSALPNDDFQASNNDLDDEIPF